MSRRRQEFSILEYFSGNDGSRCGYCGSEDTNYSRGMWAHKLMSQDYQDLIDRGWRRSGKYVYKPSMDIMCCPAYTIRCKALEFRLSKSQKKNLITVRKYLQTGLRPGRDLKLNERQAGKSEESMPVSESKHSIASSSKEVTSSASSKEASSISSSKNINSMGSDVSKQAESAKQKKLPKLGTGPDPSKPLQKKAKVLRREAKLKKRSGEARLEKEGNHVQHSNEPKTLEAYLSEETSSSSSAVSLKLKLVRSSPPSSEFQDTFDMSYKLYKRYQETIHKDPPYKCTHQQIKLIRTSPPSLEFQESFKESHEIFRKYQMTIHKEKASECTESDFKRFLCDSPLVEEYQDDGPRCGYGSFHQQYWLDDKLIAVGVLDILPHCISSVYFYYDPDFNFLTLGTYSSLREIAFTREIQKKAENIKYYYMGFYIHSCPKMRYKGQIDSSYLLCPEAYTWQPIINCRPKLDENKYSRLDPTNTADTEVDVNKVLTLHKGTAMPYSICSAMRGSSNDKDEVSEYASLVGHVCAYRMLLYRQ